MWHENILSTIGNTPLVRLNRLGSDIPCTILIKLESSNPGGSVKDRIGIAMVEEAERTGKLRPGGTIIECTSGNTGAGLALAAIAKGYRCIFTTTDKQSHEKVSVLRALGAEVIVCPTNVAPEDPKSYYSVAARLNAEIENSFHTNQYDNPANTQAHYKTTGPELWQQTDGRITHFIAGAGTGGTISGTGNYLKEQNKDVKIIGVDPFGSVYYKYFHTQEFDVSEVYPYITEGVGEDILAGNMNFDVVDDYVRVTDHESMQTTRRLSSNEGLFLGGSSGMVVAGALQWMRAHLTELTADDVVVILTPDSGFRYLSKIFNDAWMKNHGFLESRTDVTADSVLRIRSVPERDVVSISDEEPLSAAIELMNQNGISQIPVFDADNLVGSLTESDILSLLIAEPDARQKPVKDVMTAPFPVVARSLPVDELSSYLSHSPGAVLVPRNEDEAGYDVITKSDLIGALVEIGSQQQKLTV
jgi:cystathionine beta-synthase